MLYSWLATDSGRTLIVNEAWSLELFIGHFLCNRPLVALDI